MSTNDDALRCANWLDKCSFDVGESPAHLRRLVAENEAQAKQISELERLCDATYVAKGADAYNHACDEMERWQAERKKAGKDAGTKGSLCDGIAWLYDRLERLESENEAQAALLRQAVEVLESYAEITCLDNEVTAAIRKNLEGKA